MGEFFFELLQRTKIHLPRCDQKRFYHPPGNCHLMSRAQVKVASSRMTTTLLHERYTLRWGVGQNDKVRAFFAPGIQFFDVFVPQIRRALNLSQMFNRGRYCFDKGTMNAKICFPSRAKPELVAFLAPSCSHQVAPLRQRRGVLARLQGRFFLAEGKGSVPLVRQHCLGFEGHPGVWQTSRHTHPRCLCRCVCRAFRLAPAAPM